MLHTAVSAHEKKQQIEQHMASIMTLLGLDLADDSLAETPHRIAKMYVDEIFAGLDYSTFPKITLIENKMGTDEMIKVQDIGVTSTCEHHFVTIDGRRRRLVRIGTGQRCIDQRQYLYRLCL
jgi:GTP cyclohydrolase I